MLKPTIIATTLALIVASPVAAIEITKDPSEFKKDGADRYFPRDGMMICSVIKCWIISKSRGTREVPEPPPPECRYYYDSGSGKLIPFGPENCRPILKDAVP